MFKETLIFQIAPDELCDDSLYVYKFDFTFENLNPSVIIAFAFYDNYCFDNIDSPACAKAKALMSDVFFEQTFYEDSEEITNSIKNDLLSIDRTFNGSRTKIKATIAYFKKFNSKSTSPDIKTSFFAGHNIITELVFYHEDLNYFSKEPTKDLCCLLSKGLGKLTVNNSSHVIYRYKTREILFVIDERSFFFQTNKDISMLQEDVDLVEKTAANFIDEILKNTIM